MLPVWHLVIDWRSSMHSRSATRLQNMAVESRGAKYHGVWTPMYASFRGIWWGNYISFADLRSNILGCRTYSLEKTLNLIRLMGLGHVLYMLTERLRRCKLFCEAGRQCLELGCVGQSVTWQKGAKTLTNVLTRVGAVRLPVWGPQISRSDGWRLGNVVLCCSQWLFWGSKYLRFSAVLLSYDLLSLLSLLLFSVR